MDVAAFILVSTVGLFVFVRDKRARAAQDRREVDRDRAELESLREKFDALKALVEADAEAGVAMGRDDEQGSDGLTLSFGKGFVYIDYDSPWVGSRETCEWHRIGTGDNSDDERFGPGRWFIRTRCVSGWTEDSPLPTPRDVPSVRWREAPETLAMFAEGQFRRWREMRHILFEEKLVPKRSWRDEEVLRDVEGS
jgi:hypothetical protein